MSLPLPARRLLTAQEAAQYLGLKSPNTLKAHVRIAPVKIGDSVRYDVRDLDRWVDARTQSRPITADDWLGKLDEDQGEGRQALS
ncbi:helix-turn-helix domain-containing protein [Pelagibacterium sp. 26DY04]|uniref:helix-turn-helix domain-containing protein n=1 Tax=Pelagibacterium sp. 26DY04 TaxID=2967130 RepID=UPI002815D855|nr:helix-turn-helix domain-containing protein [Pelagibacterium sp. 26DY04]WMT88231.1 helix-turn-helix domain-containing protein [Pelagibacterium sp. 26DY04]